jgi:putative spermidine/putrescine transport system ATP-binding protein
MDEPLGALDKKLREQLQLEIKKIHEDLSITVLYVTHDQSESDHVCVMNRSRIVQIGTPKELYFPPRTEFVADFLGESNLFAASIESIADGIAIVRMRDGTAVRTLVVGQRSNEANVKIMIRPEAVEIAVAQRNEKQSAGDCPRPDFCRTCSAIHCGERWPRTRGATWKPFPVG